MTGTPDIADLPMEELRALRAHVRRAAELARLRSRQAEESGQGTGQGVAELEAQVAALTDALIARYAADLSLVDSLLGDAYPAEGTRRGVSRS